MTVREKGYHELVTENSVMELTIQEFNMLMLHELFETRDFLQEHYKVDIEHLDGIDQAEVALEVFKRISDYKLYFDVDGITISEVFEDEEFENSIDEYIASFESTY